MSRLVVDDIPDSLHRQFRMKVLQAGTTMSAEVRRFIAEYCAAEIVEAREQVAEFGRTGYVPIERRLAGLYGSSSPERAECMGTAPHGPHEFNGGMHCPGFGDMHEDGGAWFTVDSSPAPGGPQDRDAPDWEWPIDDGPAGNGGSEVPGS